MSRRPNLQMTLSSVNNSIEDVQCGCVIHRMKGYKRKRRWGQLRMTTDNNQAKCIIQLFKHDLSQSSPEPTHKKEPKRKFEMEFTRDNFCGIESGEHHDRYGTRRYLCIITREKHLIIEDAVMTATGINHNILGTWHQSILEAMVYVNRWKIIETDPKLASTKVCYLHVSAENVSECHSLEDKTRDNRNCLVLRTWKTKDLDQVKEHETTTDGTTTTDIAFQVPTSFGGTSVVNMSVEGSPNFRHIINNFKADAKKPTTTVCPGYDDLKSGPNLIKVSTKEKKSLSSKLLGNGFGNRGNSSTDKPSKNEKLESRNSHPLGNLYVQLTNGTNHDEHQYRNVPQHSQAPCVESDRPNPGACHNGRPGPSTLMVGPPTPCPHNSNPKVVVPPSLASQSPVSDADFFV
uniref:Uncharacterized protein LOC100179220 n=1 Tax=Phallusia mammillata TaxID=59560 RepID=A0A6F9DGB1_9ASCI|nr:uncharacterized protein LOC100179220 [Phallusia mammillata]